MPNLRSLDLTSVKLSDEFYSTMAAEASQSKVYPNTIFIGNDLFRNIYAFFKLNLWGNRFSHLKKKLFSFGYAHKEINHVNRRNFDAIMI